MYLLFSVIRIRKKKRKKEEKAKKKEKKRKKKQTFSSRISEKKGERGVLLFLIRKKEFFVSCQLIFSKLEKKIFFFSFSEE